MIPKKISIKTHKHKVKCLNNNIMIIRVLSYFLYPYHYDEDYEDYEIKQKFIEDLNQVLRDKQKKIDRLSHVSIKTELLLNEFCRKKECKMRQNISDFEFEKNITYEINDPYMFIVEHSFTHEECDSMLEQFEAESSLHYNGVTGGGYTPMTKRTVEINISKCETWQKWNRLCFLRLQDGLNQYARHCRDKCHNEFLCNIDDINDTGYQLQKYMKEQQFYKWHQDGGLKENAHQHRIITFLWYLNDVDEGGETYFYHCKVKPQKGRLILFPACWSYNHKGQTPISNDKYIITGWLYSSH